MKTIKVKCLGVEVSKEVPSSLAELAKLGLDENAVVGTCVKHILYHVYLGDVRDKVQELVEEGSYPKREFTYAVNKKGDETSTKVYKESVEKWLTSLVAAKTMSQAELNDIVNAAVEQVEFKATSPREKKDPNVERWTKMAAQIEGSEELQGKFRTKCDKLDIELPDGTLTTQMIVEGLRAIEEA
jgi:hypothetical protein